MFCQLFWNFVGIIGDTAKSTRFTSSVVTDKRLAGGTHVSIPFPHFARKISLVARDDIVA
jgi:hypothetical protein